MRIAFNSLFSTESTLVSINTYFEDVDVEFELVEKGDCELTLAPLHLLPFKEDRSFSVFSLLSMSERRYFLLIRSDVFNSDDRIGLPDGATILTSDTFLPDKILTIKENLQIEHADTLQIINQIKNSEVPIAIVEGCFLDEAAMQDYHITKLDEREFGHAPGQGFLALTGPIDHRLSKLLRRKTPSEHVLVCNVERKMAQQLESKINNHCEVDQNGNIHLWANSGDGNIHISQSTRLNIEERALEKLASLI